MAPTVLQKANPSGAQAKCHQAKLAYYFSKTRFEGHGQMKEPDYLRQGILSRDPFQSLDTRGVGPMIEIAVNKGRREKPKLKRGICSEHGGDPDSIHFLSKVGLNYVSCSPFRVPVARLAAVQAALARLI
jgi:phosphoenolpyruvate synthase/pyruvate phosphate dikinase